jgi:hypothetical protein
MKKNSQKEKKISNFVDEATKAGDFVLEVTMKRVYRFENHTNGWTPQELIQDFFKNFDINTRHASRDYHQVGGADVITAIKLLKPGELLTVEKEKLKKQKSESLLNAPIKPSDYEYCPHCHDSFSFRKCGKDFKCSWCHKDVRKTGNIV